MTRATCEDAYLVLDVNQFQRQGVIVRGKSSSVAWHRGGGEFASMNITCPNMATLALDYAWHGQPTQYEIHLDWTGCHYGGGRPWFLCCECGGKAVKLYPYGSHFACRRCCNLCYESQLEPPKFRGYDAAHKLWQKLGYDAPPTTRPRRPKGMRRKTFRRICDQARKAYEKYNAKLFADIFRTSYPF